MKDKLTKYEKQILKDLYAGEFRPVENMEAEKERYSSYARAQFKDSNINIRVNSNELIKFKKKAESKGIKYQTLLNVFIKQYNKGEVEIKV